MCCAGLGPPSSLQRKTCPWHVRTLAQRDCCYSALLVVLASNSGSILMEQGSQNVRADKASFAAKQQNCLLRTIYFFLLLSPQPNPPPPSRAPFPTLRPPPGSLTLVLPSRTPTSPFRTPRTLARSLALLVFLPSFFVFRFFSFFFSFFFHPFVHSGSRSSTPTCTATGARRFCTRT